MSIDLRGKRALVTGSSSGMGFDVARRFAESGAEVHIHGRNEKGIATATKRLMSEYPTSALYGHTCNLGSPTEVGELLKAVPDIDILVNNTGPTPSTSIFDIHLDEWQQYLDTYLTAGMLLGRTYLPKMMERGWGRILYGAGITCSYTPGSRDVAATMTAWLVAKTAMLGLARSLAEVAAGSGVTVNAFIAGPTHTEDSFLARVSVPDKGTYRDFEQKFFSGPGMSSLLGRFIDPREVADAVTFLVAPEASAITGSVLRVDGGIIRTAL
jgi:NAD(P)-dependent dehydrogenase (short-subunit alcohol dehydrogenase family)